VQGINIKLRRNEGAEDWSIEISGLRHEHVCAQEMKDLIEAAVFVAEKPSSDERPGALERSEIISELSSPSTNWVEVMRPESAIEHQLDEWIKQVSEANNELATALYRLKDCFELLLEGQRIADAKEVLSQVERALESACMARNVA
jgi:hypothetical protein